MISFILLFLRYSIGNLLLWPLLLFSSKMRRRIEFEKNYTPKTLIETDIWFHVSSEGEWEQIWPLVQFFCNKEGKKASITIWFTSTSLKNRVDRMLDDCEQYPQISIYNLALLGINPFGHHSILRHRAPKLFFMVRYDFFPELMWKGLQSEQFILLSGTLKNKSRGLERNFVKRMIARNRYGYFDQIVAATHKDREAFIKLLGNDYRDKVESYDFRHIQILERQSELKNLKESHFQDSFVQLLEHYPIHKRIILGNFWFHERGIFTDEFIEAIKTKSILVFIAPHLLKGQEFDSIKEWFEQFRGRGLEVVTWDKVGVQGEGNIILCHLPGLLCELYPYFGHCYIANGFGRSVHSILEPFWGGGNLYCGPRIHRSTEYSFAQEYYRDNQSTMPFILNSVEDLNSAINESRVDEGRKKNLDKLADEIEEEALRLQNKFYNQYQAIEQGH